MDVARWVPVSLRWVEHRAEPLIRERLWGCDVPLPDDIRARLDWWAEAGFDKDGRPVAFRRISKWEGEEETETVGRGEGGDTVVHLAGGAGVARTSYGPTGHAVRTTYVDEDGDTTSEETYHYDKSGRLTAIEESGELTSTHHGTERLYTGGRLKIEYDGDDVARIVGLNGEIVWERPAKPWGERLAEVADRLVAEYRKLLAGVLETTDLDTGTESYGLALVYVDQGSVHATLMIGLEADRLEAGGGEGGAIDTFHIEGDVPWIHDEILSEAEDAALLRDAAMAQPDNPYRVVLGEVARRLSDHDLPGLTKTPDFVAWVAEHDEGLAEKVSSIRLHNSAEAVARWEAGWGGQVLPFCND